MREVGCEIVEAPLARDADGWRLDLAALREAVRDDTAMIIINTPHNPTGTIFTDAELEAVAAEARRVGAVVLADEVYERLLYDGHPHRSIADLGDSGPVWSPDGRFMAFVMESVLWVIPVGPEDLS